jgi:Domain of unknown function (DUF4326)
MPKLYNKATNSIPPGAVYIGRPSRWGNPFHLNREVDRDYVCDKFGSKVISQLDVSELRGKDLVCWCAPRRCHGDSILRKANS